VAMAQRKLRGVGGLFSSMRIVSVWELIT